MGHACEYHDMGKSYWVRHKSIATRIFAEETPQRPGVRLSFSNGLYHYPPHPTRHLRPVCRYRGSSRTFSHGRIARRSRSSGVVHVEYVGLYVEIISTNSSIFKQPLTSKPHHVGQLFCVNLLRRLYQSRHCVRARIWSLHALHAPD